ncbi:DUF3267 domain-containing protein [Candidatus Parcubacteria bacterium]|nr:DUF3267 domain-containing protein [Candidatus Parcubacteria bacterium]
MLIYKYNLKGGEKLATKEEREEMEKSNLIIPMRKVYIVSTIVAIFVVVFPFRYLIQEEIIRYDFSYHNYMLYFWLSLGISIILHEALHALVFRIEGAKKEEVKFGIKWWTIIPAPYVHCDAELKVSSFKRSLIVPFIVLGLVPLVIGLIIGSGVVVLLGMIMIPGSVGDLLMFKLLCPLPADQRMQDHPDLAGYKVRI